MQRQNFIDWMKAVGMFVIVFGHVIGSPYHIFNLVSQPVYTKQLGVCFFIFVIGWGLANEKRNTFQVVFNRLFPVYFYGVIFALLLSVLYYFTVGNLVESNYLPFFLGSNVFFNFFPGNPTTWYIGTYLHVLLFWFFFMRGKRITLPLVILGSVCEIAIRASLIYADLDFVAYMTLPNWLTVFLLGAYLHQQRDTGWDVGTIVLAAFWVVIFALWSSDLNTFIYHDSFPFREIAGVDNLHAVVPSLQRSLLISFVYIFSTFVLFQVFRRLPELGIINFFARNSLITFILHMPLIQAFAQPFYSLFDNVLLAQWIYIFVVFIGCALISEVINKIVNVNYFKSIAWNIFEKIFGRFMQPKAN